MITKVGTERISGLQNSNPQADTVEKFAKYGLTNPRQSVKSNLLPFTAQANAAKFIQAMKAKAIYPLAKTIPFTGDSLISKLNEETQGVAVCADELNGKPGEQVGVRVFVNSIIDKYADYLPQYNAASKIDVIVKKEGNQITLARTQLKNLSEGGNNNYLFQMAVKSPEYTDMRNHRDMLYSNNPSQHIVSLILPPNQQHDEKAYILNSKGSLTVVIEDEENVILTSAGIVKKREGSTLDVICEKFDDDRRFKQFIPSIPVVSKLTPQKSIGKGGEIIIGMEEGRFCPEIVNSIKEFEEKINSEEIVLPQFKAIAGAKKIQVAMLSAGFGSRAEYTNASSDAIFHGKKDGAHSTKGVFRMPTGLTPMETTFISLHQAGILDCSKGKFGIGKNVKFYLNKTGVNKGNGGFTAELYERAKMPNQICEFIVPNDSISRMPIAVAKVADLMNSGDAAIAMIAKKVPSKDAQGNFGIMKLSEDNEILEFAEKPKVIPEGFEDKDGYCLTNTFQFAVSKEAFEALNLIEPFFSSALQGKETRDWSKHLIPTIMVIAQCDTADEMRDHLQKTVGEANNPKYVNFLESIPDDILMSAKEILGKQKVVAVPTDESWADVGQLAGLYDATMEIAKGNFKLTDFERKNVINSINPHTGLVAMTPKQKADIEDKYDITGEVMVVPMAKKIDPTILDTVAEFTIVNP